MRSKITHINKQSWYLTSSSMLLKLITKGHFYIYKLKFALDQSKYKRINELERDNILVDRRIFLICINRFIGNTRRKISQLVGSDI